MMEDIIKRLPPKVWDFTKMKIFKDKQHELEIQNLAMGLEKDEVLAWFGLSPADLSMHEEDAFFFNITFDRARLLAKQNAVAKVFKSMDGKDGLAASLSYLAKFGNEKWQSDATGGAKIPKNIKITFDEMMH